MINFKELRAYMFVGALATLVDTTLFYMLVSCRGFDYRIALLIASAIGIFCNFLLCNYFIFHRGAKSFLKACVQHYIASAFGLLLNQLGMIILISGLQCKNILFSRLFVATFTFVINYALIKRFVFISKNKN